MPNDFISSAFLVSQVRYFLLHSPEHEEILAEGCGISIPTIRRWASGINLPHSPMMPSVVIFIKEHMRSCVCAK